MENARRNRYRGRREIAANREFSIESGKFVSVPRIWLDSCSVGFQFCSTGRRSISDASAKWLENLLFTIKNNPSDLIRAERVEGRDPR